MIALLAHSSSGESSVAVTVALAVGAVGAAAVPYVRRRLARRRPPGD